MNLLTEAIISLFLVLGGVFLLVGSYALVKLPDTMQRLHGPTKATTLGVGGMLIASMLYFWFEQNSFSIHELLITLFLFVTAPVTAHMIARAHQHTDAGPDEPGLDEDEVRTQSKSVIRTKRTGG